MMKEAVIFDATKFLRSFSDPFPDDLLPLIRAEMLKRNETIVVLDDDPTGTQTVYDIPVLTDWSVDSIRKEFVSEIPLFYILTNSRSLPSEDAELRIRKIGQNLVRASKQTGRKFLVVSRSDSTLRGHYPMEVEILEEELDLQGAIKVMIPAFFEGGRYTIQDVHYVREGDTLIPAAKTPFAEDKVFGFNSSDLKEYVEEKSNRKIKSEQVVSFSIMELREQNPTRIAAKINRLPPGVTCIVNAASYRDLEVFTLGYFLSNRQLIFRTAASIVPVLAGLKKRSLLSAEDLLVVQKQGILLVVGSYVPKTTSQLNALKGLPNLESVEINVHQVIQDEEDLQNICQSRINNLLSQGKDVVLYTSRKLVGHSDPHQSLQIGNRVSEFLVSLVKGLLATPGCILAKGGITSSDVATKGLGVKRALVLGQVAPGIPVWKLGLESKFPGMYYVVFPGNVGDEDALKDVYLKISGK